MTEQTKAAMTPEAFLKLVDQIDAAIPKMKQLVAQMQANPTILAVAGKLIPGVSTLVPLLLMAGPFLGKVLDWLQQLTDAIQAAEQQAGNGN